MEKEKRTSIPMTNQQHQMCRDYINGKLTMPEMHILFKTYLNEYIELFGWDSWKKDPIEIILDNFCSASTTTTDTTITKDYCYG